MCEKMNDRKKFEKMCDDLDKWRAEHKKPGDMSASLDKRADAMMQLEEIEKSVGNYQGDTVFEMVESALCQMRTVMKCRNPVCDNRISAQKECSVFGLCSECAENLVRSLSKPALPEYVIDLFCAAKNNFGESK